MERPVTARVRPANVGRVAHSDTRRWSCRGQYPPRHSGPSGTPPLPSIRGPRCSPPLPRPAPVGGGVPVGDDQRGPVLFVQPISRRKRRFEKDGVEALIGRPLVRDPHILPGQNTRVSRKTWEMSLTSPDGGSCLDSPEFSSLSLGDFSYPPIQLRRSTIPQIASRAFRIRIAFESRSPVLRKSAKGSRMNFASGT